MIIGRVASVTVENEPKQKGSLLVTYGTARIERLEAVQGETEASYEVTDAVQAERLPGSDAMVCVDFLRVEAGDIVFGLERPDRSLRIFEPHQIPEDLRPRLEAYR